MSRVLVGDVLLITAFLLLVLRIVRPWRIKPIGPVLRRHPVTLLGRLRMMGRQFLIVVGVGLDTVKQIESQLQQRNYEGFLR